MVALPGVGPLILSPVEGSSGGPTRPANPSYLPRPLTSNLSSEGPRWKSAWPPGPYRPLNAGSRFSMKDRLPSCASSESETGCSISVCKVRPLSQSMNAFIDFFM